MRARSDPLPGVDDELPGMGAAVEAPVRDREQAQVDSADRAAARQKPLGLQLGPDGLGQRLARGMKRSEREHHRR